jgi:hypothetical protein
MLPILRGGAIIKPRTAFPCRFFRMITVIVLGGNIVSVLEKWMAPMGSGSSECAPHPGNLQRSDVTSCRRRDGP